MISGNGGEGIILSGVANAQLQRNLIGTDAGGTLSRGNSWDAISVDFGTTGMIGSDTTGLGNTIANTTSGHGLYVGTCAGP